MTREAAVRQLFERTVSLTADQRTELLGKAADDVVSQTRLMLTAATAVGTKVPPPTAPPTPHQVGRYKIDGVLGQGGFGIVYRGRDTVLKRSVAIKTCISDDPERREQFVHEAEISAGLQHPNIVTIYDFGVEDGLPYLVQELLSGQDMSAMIRGRPATPDEVEQRTNVLVGVAEGLAHAHRHGVVHRDVKPGNVRLTRSGAIKLLDFGIARLLHHPGDPTQDDAAAGTIGYLAPELLEGSAVGKPADVFSFGALAYEWLSGERAFVGDTFSEVAYNLLFKPIDVEPVRSSGAKDELVELISRCLEKDPASRFGDAEAVADALRDLTTTAQPTVVLDPSTVDVAAADTTRTDRRRTAWISGTSAAVLVALGVGSMLIGSDAEPPNPTAAREAATLAPARPAASSGLPAEAAIDTTPELDPATTPPIDEEPSIDTPTPATAEPAPPPAALPDGAVAPAAGSSPPVTTDAVTTDAFSTDAFSTDADASGDPASTEAPTRPPSAEPAPTAPAGGADSIESPPIDVEARTPSPPERSEPRPAVSDDPPAISTVDDSDPIDTPRPAAEPSVDAAPPLYTEGAAGVVPPRVIDRQVAEYPRRARRQRVAAQVVVAVLVDVRGQVVQTLLERRDRHGLGFNEAAEAAARETRFEPATRDGVPGRMWTRLIFDFRP